MSNFLLEINIPLFHLAYMKHDLLKVLLFQ